MSRLIAVINAGIGKNALKRQKYYTKNNMKEIDILSIQIRSDIETLKRDIEEGVYRHNRNAFLKDFSRIVDKMIKRSEIALGIPEEKHYCTKCGEYMPKWEEDSLCQWCI